MQTMHPLNTDQGSLQLQKTLARLPNTAELLELINQFKTVRLAQNQTETLLKHLQNKQYSKVQSILSYNQ